jgi:F-type H+-transporting ATPase subunit delta
MAARFTRPYVDALFDVAGSAEKVEALLPGLDAFAASLAHSEELRNVVRNPGVARPQKRAVLKAIAAREEISPLAERLLESLLTNRRLHLLPEVLRALRERLDRDRGIVEASLHTATPLDGDHEKSIRAALERRTGKTVRLKPEVDPVLLGGFVARIGSEIYDASLKSRLERTQHALHHVTGPRG